MTTHHLQTEFISKDSDDFTEILDSRIDDKIICTLPWMCAVIALNYNGSYRSNQASIKSLSHNAQQVLIPNSLYRSQQEHRIVEISNDSRCKEPTPIPNEDRKQRKEVAHIPKPFKRPAVLDDPNR